MAKIRQMVVKVQRPLSGSQDDGMCLVYPKERSPSAVQQVPEKVMRILMARSGGKAWFDATISTESGYFTIGDQVPDEDW